MRGGVKLFIASLLLLFVTSVTTGGVACVPTQAEGSLCVADGQFTTQSFVHSHTRDHQTYSDGEVFFTSLLEAFVQNNQFRARRVAHFSILLKTSMYKLCLQCQRAELTDTCNAIGIYTPVRNLQTCSDVFALRHILI